MGLFSYSSVSWLPSGLGGQDSRSDPLLYIVTKPVPQTKCRGSYYATVVLPKSPSPPVCMKRFEIDFLPPLCTCYKCTALILAWRQIHFLHPLSQLASPPSHPRQLPSSTSFPLYTLTSSPTRPLNFWKMHRKCWLKIILKPQAFVFTPMILLSYGNVYCFLNGDYKINPTNENWHT